jgi:predicted TIM-barrel enzyme
MPRTIAEVRAGLSNRCRVLDFSSMRLIGMVHVPPLPGSPRWAGSMERVSAAALADARALVDNGMDAVLVENWGDAPFTPGRVEPATVAALTVVAHEIRRACPTTPLGINVLKSDARAALAVACAVGARFIRVNVHAGAVVADQGLVQSDAYHTLRGATPRVRLLVGSGATPETIAELLSIADGAIVGTSLKHDGDVDAPIDPARVRRLVAATRSG